MVKKNFAEAARNHGIFNNDESSRPDPRDYASPTPIGGPEREEQRQQFLRQRKVQRLRDLVHEKLGFVEYPSVISALQTVIQSAPESAVNAIPSQIELEKMANDVRRLAGQAVVPLTQQSVAATAESSGPSHTAAQSSRRLSKNQSVPDLDLMSRRSINAAPTQLSRSESVKAIQPASPSAAQAISPSSPSQSAQMPPPQFPGMDEWTLLVMAQKAQQEAQAQAAAERERAVKAKTSNDLQRQMVEREQLRQRQMEEKQRQLQLIQEQTEQWKREEENRKRAEKMRQQVVRHNLTESLEEKKSSQSQALRSRREEEERLLRVVAQKEAEEAQREKEAKMKRKEHNDQMRLENEHQEELKRMHRQQQKAEDVRILENYSRMLEEQEMQRKHYISSLKRQQDALEQHAKSRGLEQAEADRMEDERRRLAMLEAERKQAEREQAVAQARKLVAVDTLHALEQQMKSRAEQEREQRVQAAFERQRLAQRLAQEQEMEKQKEIDRKLRNEQYRGELQSQMQVNQVKKQSDKVMSEEDRKLHASYLRQYAQMANTLSPSNRDTRSSLVSTPSGTSIDISTLPKAVALQVQQMGRASPQPYSPTHLFSSSPTASSLSPLKPQMLSQMRLSTDEPQSPSAQKYSRNSPFGSMARSMFA